MAVRRRIGAVVSCRSHYAGMQAPVHSLCFPDLTNLTTVYLFNIPLPTTLHCHTQIAQAAKAIVSSVLMNIAIVGINQVYDKKLDRVGVVQLCEPVVCWYRN